jgi:phosphinothricin acetyltransferase
LRTNSASPPAVPGEPQPSQEPDGTGGSTRGAEHAPEAGHTLGAGRVLGWATSSPFRARAAYATSVEVSVYCAADAVGRGVGTLLHKSLLEALEGEDPHRAYAGITQPNEASTRLHAKFGFQHLGTYREVGRKSGRYWDVAWYEKPLDAA